MAMYEKHYLTMIIRVDTGGNIKPVAIEWEDGRKFSVDKVLSIINAPPVHIGGLPTQKYDVIVEGRRKFLYRECATGKWFVERQIDKNSDIK